MCHVGHLPRISLKLGLSLLLCTDVFTVTFKTGAEHIPILIGVRFPFLEEIILKVTTAL